MHVFTLPVSGLQMVLILSVYTKNVPFDVLLIDTREGDDLQPITASRGDVKEQWPDVPSTTADVFNDA